MFSGEKKPDNEGLLNAYLGSFSVFLFCRNRHESMGFTPETMKIVMYWNPASSASPRHGGRVFFELFVTDPPRGRPFGGGGNHRKWRSV